MKKQLIIYGSVLALLAILIKWIEYRYLVINYAVEIYGSALAIIFTVVGLWVGRKLTTPKEKIVREEVIVEKPVYITSSSHSDLPKADPEKLGISKREMEILELMAQGFSNQEIAEKTFLSIHTIKTHASNLFMKLDVKRRTQAISRAKELNLIS
ncbi:MAG TPA: LuxR C-terminal-related transcriptional regulator [Flavipsychrobacter sp.]|nr:LuxR C-terminal-related transcriptional regulator [Flavipsychrobacter sp.]